MAVNPPVTPSVATPILAMPASYYQQLLTSQYRLSPKVNAWLLAIISAFQDLNNLYLNFLDAFDLDTATGPQLDILGQLVGVSRTVSFQPSGGVSPVLDDKTYLLLIRATIAKNYWNGTQNGLWEAWQIIYPGTTIIIHDNQNMTADVFVTGAYTSIEKDLIQNGYIVPRPETVEYTYSFGILPAFGFDLDSATIAGFDKGHFV